MQVVSRREFSQVKGYSRPTVKKDEYLALVYVDDYHNSLAQMAEKAGIKQTSVPLYDYHQWVLVCIRTTAIENGWTATKSDRALLAAWVNDNAENLNYASYEIYTRKSHAQTSPPAMELARRSCFGASATRSKTESGDRDPK